MPRRSPRRFWSSSRLRSPSRCASCASSSSTDVEATGVGTRSGPARRALLWLTLVAVALASVLPLLWALTSSLRPDDQIFLYTLRLSWKTLLPIGGTLQNFREILFE